MAEKVPLPKGLVDLSTAHSPIIEPTILGLPYHGLVVNGKLTLPNGKIINYKQPKALSHKTVTYCQPPYFLPEPPPGRWTDFGKLISNYERRYLGGTILVKGKNTPEIKRTEKELAEDYKNGYQWKDYAYLSGTFRQIGGSELEPGIRNDFGDGDYGTDLECASTYGGDNSWIEGTILPGGVVSFQSGGAGKEPSTIVKGYNQGYWLYNDGSITWLMRWNVYPSQATILYNPIRIEPKRILRIWVMKPFGIFGAIPEVASMTPVLVYEGPWDVFEGGRGEGDEGGPIWLPYYSADGSTVAINEVWIAHYTSCTDPFIPYWLSSYIVVQHHFDIHMGDGDPNTGEWLSELARLFTWAEIKISGKGSLSKGTVGQGITVDINLKLIDYDWDPPSQWGCGLCSIVTPEGKRGYWYTDCNPGAERGTLKCTLGGAIGFKFYMTEHHEDVIACHLGTNPPGQYVYQGVYLYDDGLMAVCFTGKTVNSYTAVHLQGLSSCIKGVSYDIVNRKWSTIENSCYV